MVLRSTASPAAPIERTTLDPAALFDLPLGDLNWPGWPVEQNPFGPEFDLAARRRMVLGSRRLRGLLGAHLDVHGLNAEAGPFFDPLLPPGALPGHTLYWDNDATALRALEDQAGPRDVAVFADLSELGTGRFRQTTAAALASIGRGDAVGFDGIVTSQLFNYLDLSAAVAGFAELLAPGGRIFANEIVDYGLPSLFHARRPADEDALPRALRRAGLRVVERVLVGQPHPDKSTRPRQLLVAAKGGAR